MSINIRYVATPPQYARTQALTFYNAATTTHWEIGDVVSIRYESGEDTAVYRCTTAGSVSAYWSTTITGQSPLAADTTIWEKQTPDTWAKAGPFYVATAATLPNLVIYIDSACTHAPAIASNYTAKMVVVDRNTMLPAACQANHAPGDYGSYGRFARSPAPEQLALKTLTAPGGDLTYFGDLVTMYASLGQANTITRTYTTAQTIPLPDGSSIKDGTLSRVVAPATSEAQTASYTGALFAAHVEATPPLTAAPVTGARYGVYTTTSRNAVDSEYVSNDTFMAAWPCALGEGAGLLRNTDTYRTSGVPAGERSLSLRLFGGDYPSPTRLALSSFIVVQNTLTGSRTITAHLTTDSPWGANLTNADIFMEVLYSNSATTAQYGFASTMSAHFGVIDAAHTKLTEDATATWVYGVVNFPTNLKISTTVSIGSATPLFIRFGLGGYNAAHWQVYVCPYIEVV